MKASRRSRWQTWRWRSFCRCWSSAGLIAWLQNVHIITANGMYKSIQAEPWIADSAHARLDPSNYLYFPLYGALGPRCSTRSASCAACRGSSSPTSTPSGRASAVVVVYAFVHRLTGSARVAALAACFHFGCGFVLLLAVISEDIMPGYTLVLGRCCWPACGSTGRATAAWRWSARSSPLGWLIEWRLMFPTLPALVLALALAPGRPARRAGADRHAGRLDPGRRRASCSSCGRAITARSGLHDLLWTGKGVDHRLGRPHLGQGLDDAVGHRQLFPDRRRLGRSAVGQARRLAAASPRCCCRRAIFVASVVVLWPRRAEPRLRAIAIVFLGTLGAGQVLNFYSQPQDPQMQINVMPWLTVAWGLLLGGAGAAGRA